MITETLDLSTRESTWTGILISGRPEDRQHLESLGIIVGFWHSGTFFNCILPSESRRQLNQFWGRYFWGRDDPALFIGWWDKDKKH